jgi:putative restriction endonuclease
LEVDSFTKFLLLPVSLAWEAFGEGNGARSIDEVRICIGKYRKQPMAPHDDPKIVCIILEERFFFDRDDWSTTPSDFKAPTQVARATRSMAVPDKRCGRKSLIGYSSTEQRP